MSDLPRELYYPLLNFLLFGAAVILVPRRNWRVLFTAGILLGCLSGAVFILIFGKLLRLFHYQSYGAFHVFGLPFWILLAWLPTMVLFLHFLPERKQTYLFCVHILGFSLFSMGLDLVLKQLDLIVYVAWGPLPRLILALVWFGLAAFIGPDLRRE